MTAERLIQKFPATWLHSHEEKYTAAKLANFKYLAFTKISSYQDICVSCPSTASVRGLAFSLLDPSAFHYTLQFGKAASISHTKKRKKTWQTFLGFT